MGLSTVPGVYGHGGILRGTALGVGVAVSATVISCRRDTTTTDTIYSYRWRRVPSASPAEDRHSKELQRAERIAQKADAAQRLAKMGRWK